MTISSVKLLNVNRKLLITCMLAVLSAFCVFAAGEQPASGHLFSAVNKSGKPITSQVQNVIKSGSDRPVEIVMYSGLEVTYYKLDVDSDCGGVGKIDCENPFEFESAQAFELLKLDDVVDLSISPILNSYSLTEEAICSNIDLWLTSYSETIDYAPTSSTGLVALLDISKAVLIC